MEITSRQRARLKSIASNYDTIFQIGKNAISDELIKQLSGRTGGKGAYKDKSS